MKTTITIQDETLAGEILNTLFLQVEKESLTLAELITARVKAEVDTFNQSSSDHFQGLVKPLAAERILNAYKVKEKNKIDAEQQAYIALDAFQKNAFFVLVEDRQVDALDEPLLIEEHTKVSFIKMTPLVGG